MLSIRLARTGRKNRAYYRILVSEKTKDMYGDSLENLGTYNPHSKQALLKVERIKYWLSKGAQTSATVNNLLIKEKVIGGAKAKVVSISQKRQEKINAKKSKAAKNTETSAPAPDSKTEVVEASNETAV